MSTLRHDKAHDNFRDYHIIIAQDRHEIGTILEGRRQNVWAQMGRRVAKLLKEQGQLGVPDVRDWVSENDVEPYLTEQQINLVIC